MKIVINTAIQRFGGAVQVAVSFINECKEFSNHEFHVWVGPGVAKSIIPKEFPANFHFYNFNFGTIGLSKISSIQKELRSYELKIRPDVLIASAGPTYYHSLAPQIIGFNIPLYIYPESPFVQSLNFKDKVRLYIKKQLHFYFFKRDASHYVVQTDDVNDRVRKALNTKSVTTVSNTCSSFFYHPESFPNKLPEKKPGTYRLLTISSYYRHKNLDLIPQVLDSLKKRGIENCTFVLTLDQEVFDQHFESHPQLLNVGPVKPNECPSLYEECDFLFLPTLAECFSASYPEAMCMKNPIITTDLGFARSICQNAALYFTPKNASSAAEKIERLINQPHLANELVQNGRMRLTEFDTPKMRAEKYLELAGQLLHDQEHV